MMAKKAVMGVTKDEIERAYRLSREKYLMDVQCEAALTVRKLEREVRRTAKQEGLLEGKSKSEQEDILEDLMDERLQGVWANVLKIARKLKNMGMPIEQILDGTGLSINDIAAL
jgi:predicted transposase YdaD